MVHYKLTYFFFNGLGEPIRQIFALAGVDFEDHRVQREEWPALKESTPFGKMPVLEVDGKKLPQSKAIARYLGRKFGFAGNGEWEQAQVDAWADQINDYMTSVDPFFRYKAGFAEGDADAEFNDVVVKARDTFFPLVVKQLKEAGSGYLVGNKVSWADLFLNYHVETFLGFRPDYIDKYPEIAAHLKKVRDIPELKKWVSQRPSAPF
ncbi:unnamed protein product, partial [Mesorhabditis spiculigera]